MLATAVRLVAQAGFSIVNVDATVVCQRPKIAPRVAAMRAKLAAGLGLDASQVSVKATTTDGLGALGRAEGIAATAVALIEDQR